MPIMQSLSHTTRAYIINADGLRGFIFEVEIIKLLKEADQKGILDHAKMWQVIDLDELGNVLKFMDSLDEKMKYISKNYPYHYQVLLRRLNKRKRLV